MMRPKTLHAVTDEQVYDAVFAELSAEMSLADAYKYTSEVMKENLLRSDAKEGINAFLEKRTPKWDDE